MAPFSYFRNQHRRAGSTPSSDSPRSPQWKGSHSPFANSSTAAGDDSAQSPSSLRPSAIPSPALESPVSPMPPVLPPIPRVASSTHGKVHKSHSLSKSDAGPPRSNLYTEAAPARPHAEQSNASTSVEPTPIAAPILPPIPRIMTRRFPGQEPLKIRTTDTRPPDTGYRQRPPPQVQPDPPQAHHLDSAAVVSAESHDKLSHKTLPPPPSAQDFAPRPATPPVLQSTNELYPPLHNTSRRPSSPSSSFSSFQKSVSSSNLAIDSSGSSKSTQPANPTASRAIKPRMNLLNPVSLLRRRRTAQHVEVISDSPAMGLPKDYDPRIKGKGVHDFNAPRPRRHHSTNAIDSPSAPLASDASPVEEYRRRSSLAPLADLDKPAAPEHDHVTVFRENFDDNANEDSSASAVNRESLANSSFLARMSRRLDFDSPDFGSASPETGSESQAQAPSTPSAAGERTSKSTVGAPSVRISSDQSTARSSISNDTKATTPPGSPPRKHSRGSLTLEPPFQSEGLPKHFSSSASRNSRFSFQLNSEATLAQEKELEEKGKERAAKAQQQDSDADEGFGDSDDDVTDFGDFDEDPYEEEIPMVNVVDDDDPNQWHESQAQTVHDLNDNSTFNTNEGINGPDMENQQDDAQAYNSQYHRDPLRQTTQESEDSMYFDDGLIDDPPVDGTPGFDESLFDSPVRSQEKGASSDDEYAELDSTWRTGGAFPEAARDFDGLGIASTNMNDAQALSSSNFERMASDGLQSSQFYQHNPAALGKLDAYHDALASAATKAEANGRFRRQPSVDVSVSEVGSDCGSKISHVSGFEVAPVDWSETNFDDTDLDGLEDDQMVAAANAEILASDDSEFYGQEFGFYGGSSSTDAEMYNGGFFGVAQDDGKTGMNAGREPNLTPITERSEFSTRNSIISLPAYGNNHSAPNSAISRNDMPSPVMGLKELAASMNMDEDDMTLSQLIKLRKGAFGASGGNAVGSPSSSLPNGSPLAIQNAFPVQTVEEEEQEHYPTSWSLADNDYYNEQDPDATLHPEDFASIHQPSAIANTLPLRSPQLSSSAQTTPKPLSAFKTQSFTLAPNSSNTAPSPPLYPPKTAIPIISSYATARPGHSPFPSAHSFASPATAHSAPTSPAPMPMPSPSLVHKFAARPPASSASYAERQQRRSLGSAAGLTGSGDSVAYVMEDSQWYLERRRRLSTGELIVVGRELVAGGRI